MSPLAPRRSEDLYHIDQDSVAQQNFIDVGRISDAKITYSLGDLYGMRHAESRAPNISNRTLLESISRTHVMSTLNDNSSFSTRIMSSAMNQMRRDPHRPVQRLQNQINGRHVNSGPNTERNRYQSRGKLHDSQNIFLRLCVWNGGEIVPIHFFLNRIIDRGYGNGGTVPVVPMRMVPIRMSIKNDVKLSEAENAWKPSFLQKNQTNDKDEAAELYKQVRSILNKLTAQNFAILSEQFQNLQIDTKEKLVEVINLVFNKAVNEPNFSEGYAKLSQYLSHCSKQIDSSSDERAYFKRTLINKCQIEFEQHVANKSATEAALAPLMEKLKLCEGKGDTNGTNEIKAQIAEEESILRRRLVSTVRFIGELYKLNMLTTNIMNVCINVLIHEVIGVQSSNSNQANEKLECLCKLLTTVGGKLEHKPTKNSDKTVSQYLNLTDYMNQLKRIADNKIRNFKPSTRIKWV